MTTTTYVQEAIHRAVLAGWTGPLWLNFPQSDTERERFLAAVDEIAAISTRLLRSLETNAPPRNREEEAAKAKARSAQRFGA